MGREELAAIKNLKINLSIIRIKYLADTVPLLCPFNNSKERVGCLYTYVKFYVWSKSGSSIFTLDFIAHMDNWEERERGDSDAGQNISSRKEEKIHTANCSYSVKNERV